MARSVEEIETELDRVVLSILGRMDGEVMGHLCERRATLLEELAAAKKENDK